jgi:hypothetical protein
MTIDHGPALQSGNATVPVRKRAGTVPYVIIMRGSDPLFAKSVPPGTRCTPVKYVPVLESAVLYERHGGWGMGIKRQGKIRAPRINHE